MPIRGRTSARISADRSQKQILTAPESVGSVLGAVVVAALETAIAEAVAADATKNGELSLRESMADIVGAASSRYK